MKRYLVIYISEGDFCVFTTNADGILDAVDRFVKSGLEHSEIYSVQRAA